MFIRKNLSKEEKRKRAVRKFRMELMGVDPRMGLKFNQAMRDALEMSDKELVTEYSLIMQKKSRMSATHRTVVGKMAEKLIQVTGKSIQEILDGNNEDMFDSEEAPELAESPQGAGSDISTGKQEN